MANWVTGASTNRTTPVQVSGLTGVVAIAGGGNHSLALKSDGTVYAWGHNNRGQLGDGTTTQRYTPVLLSDLTGVVRIECGDSHSMALKSDGTVYAWGRKRKWSTGGRHHYAEEIRRCRQISFYPGNLR